MKKIYRVEKEKRIAGICAGIGEILEVDPTIVRLISIFACVLTGFAPLIVTYAVGWLIIPEKSPVTEKQEDIIT